MIKFQDKPTKKLTNAKTLIADSLTKNGVNCKKVKNLPIMKLPL